MEAVCLAPIDTIKTRLQLDKSKQYNGIWHCGRTIAKVEGVRALWKGVVPFSTHLTFKYALRMGSNSFYQGLFRNKDGELSDGRRLLAGAMAGATEAVFIVTPFEVVKIRLQQQRGLDKSLIKYKVCLHASCLLHGLKTSRFQPAMTSDSSLWQDHCCVQSVHAWLWPTC